MLSRSISKTESRPSQGAINAAGSRSTGRAPSFKRRVKKSLKELKCVFSHCERSTALRRINGDICNRETELSRYLPMSRDTFGRISNESSARENALLYIFSTKLTVVSQLASGLRILSVTICSPFISELNEQHGQYHHAQHGEYKLAKRAGLWHAETDDEQHGNSRHEAAVYYAESIAQKP